MLQAIIVGAGPVGLFLACRLAQLGIAFLIIDENTQPSRHSRAIGIHPPSLHRLQQLGLLDQFLSVGIKVSSGKGFINQRYFGTLNFASLEAPFNYILSLPQVETEAILKRQLQPDYFLEGITVTTINWQDDRVTVYAQPSKSQGSTRAFTARYVIACDGHKSLVRQAAGIAFEGKTYQDTYLMGDVEDSTSFQNTAALFLSNQGIVESFPLPQGLRRWVARTDSLVQVSADDLRALIQDRCDIHIDTNTCTMLSPFRVHRYLAKTFAGQGFFLVGDAAHVISPIGGQGMNLGWLDAWEVATLLQRRFISSQDFRAYSLQRRRSAIKAMRRAEFNMWMGRKSPFFIPQYVTAHVMLLPAFSSVTLRQFTMNGL